VPDPRKTPKSKYTADRPYYAGSFEGETVTRRRFMTLTAHGAGIVATSAFLLPALGFAAGSAIFERPEVVWETVGKPEDFPDDTYVPKVVTEVSGIGQTGKTTIYMRARADSDRAPNPEQLHEGTTEDFIAISTRCMHLGCPVRYVEASERFICPCHGGVYDIEGKVSGGPPVRPLSIPLFNCPKTRRLFPKWRSAWNIYRWSKNPLLSFGSAPQSSFLNHS